MVDLNIDEMEAGPELDALIAERVLNESKPVYIYPSDEVLFRSRPSTKGYWECSAIYSDGDIPKWTPLRFSTDFEAAWEVIEKLGEDGYIFHLEYDAAGTAKPIFATAEVAILQDFSRIAPGLREWETVSDADAETMPLAICRAAYKAMDEQTKTSYQERRNAAYERAIKRTQKRVRDRQEFIKQQAIEIRKEIGDPIEALTNLLDSVASGLTEEEWERIIGAPH